MEVLIPATILIALAIAGIAIKIIIKPGGTFSRTCGSAFDPDTGKPVKCTCHSNKTHDCENTNEKEKTEP